MKRIILASQSKGRKSLMERSGLPFEIIVSEYEEDHDLSTNPQELVKQLALGKAKDVAKKVKDAIVIGADTMILHNNQMMGKPKTRKEAYEQIKTLCGNTHTLISGLAVIDTNGKQETDVAKTEVTFRELNDEEINAYLDKIEYKRLAGSYEISGKTMLFIEEIKGSYSNVVGLPINKLARILKTMGINVFKHASGNT